MPSNSPEAMQLVVEPTFNNDPSTIFANGDIDPELTAVDVQSPINLADAANPPAPDPEKEPTTLPAKKTTSTTKAT
jgi:hypothetical protein